MSFFDFASVLNVPEPSFVSEIKQGVVKLTKTEDRLLDQIKKLEEKVFSQEKRLRALERPECRCPDCESVRVK